MVTTGGEWKGPAGRSLARLCFVALPWWPQPGIGTHMLQGLGGWGWEAFPSCSFSIFPFLLSLMCSKAGLYCNSPPPFISSAFTGLSTAALGQRGSDQHKTISSIYHTLIPSFLNHVRFLAACVLRVATLHKVENVRSMLTRIKTCSSLELPCQFGDIRLLENPGLGQEAINQRCNHLHLAHYDIEPHY